MEVFLMIVLILSGILVIVLSLDVYDDSDKNKLIGLFSLILVIGGWLTVSFMSLDDRTYIEKEVDIQEMTFSNGSRCQISNIPEIIPSSINLSEEYALIFPEDSILVYRIYDTQWSFGMNHITAPSGSFYVKNDGVKISAMKTFGVNVKVGRF